MTMHYVRIKYKGYILWLDKADEAMFRQHKWYPNQKGYLRRNNWVGGKNKNIMLHRSIAGATTKDEHVDHINHNIHDNRGCNLRLCTPQENSRHCKKKKPSSGGFKGVYKVRSGRFQAMIRVDDKLSTLGTFDTAQEAAQKYNEAAKLHFGEFASLNQVP